MNTFPSVATNYSSDSSTLFFLSEEMSAIRTWNDFRNVIVTKIQPLVSFDDAVIGMYSPDKLSYKRLVVMLQNDVDTDAIGKYLPIAGSPLQEFEKETSAFVWSTDEVITRFPADKGLLRMQRLGLKFTYHQQLKRGNETVGYFHLKFKDKEKFDDHKRGLYKAIAEQITITALNIIANEEIVEREIEKSLLLRISECLAKIRTRDALLTFFITDLKPVFHFDDAVLSLYNEEHLSVRHYHKTLKQRAANDIAYETIVSQSIPIAGNPHEEFMQYKEPTIIDFTDFENRYPEHPGIMVMQSLGLNESVIMPLRYDATLLGTMEFHAANRGTFKTDHISLYTSLANQVAVALSNIIATESLTERDAEKTRLLDALQYEEKIKSLQLSFNNTLLHLDDRSTLFITMAHQLSELFSVDIFGVKVIDDRKFSRRLFFSKDGNQFVPLPDVSATVPDIDSLDAHELDEFPLGVRFYTGANFDLMCKTKKLFRLSNERDGTQSVMLCPLSLMKGQRAMLVLKTRNPLAYHDEDVRLLERLLPQLSIIIENYFAFEKIESLSQNLQIENEQLIEEISRPDFEEMIGSSDKLKEVFAAIRVVAPTESTVLITGETGTGKELVARAVHNGSTRRDKPFIKINCAALPANLIESELFGHEKGAFTGAHERRIGKFELANRGTLFLDEIGEVSLETQAKLLRAIQEKEIERLGGNKVIKCDVRIIVATNRNLSHEVQQKTFRQDLYYRLNVFPIHLPALRERPSDIPALVDHFITVYRKKHGKYIKGISNEALIALKQYKWPGNIRELEHLIERAFIIERSNIIQNVFLPHAADETNTSNAVFKTMNEMERDYILQVLDYCQGKIRGPGGAAHILDIVPTTLESRMKKLGITRKQVFN